MPNVIQLQLNMHVVMVAMSLLTEKQQKRTYSPASLFAAAAAFSKSGIFFIFNGLVGGFLPAAFKKCANISVCDRRY